MEYQPLDPKDGTGSQGSIYTETSKKLEDAKSSSWLFIFFGIAGLILIACVWLGVLPLSLAFPMKLLYTIVLGALFLACLLMGLGYLKKSKTLAAETDAEERRTREIIDYITTTYSLADLDRTLQVADLPMEQRYFVRSEKIAALITEKFPLLEESYLDYLVEQIYQIYAPEESL